MSAIKSELHELGAPPRRARLHTRFRILRWALVGAALVPGSCLYGLGRWETARLQVLAREGAVTPGQVCGKRVSRGRSPDFYLYASFEVDGRWYEMHESVPRDRYDGTSIGTAVEITYLPRDPEHSALDRVDDARVERQSDAFAGGAFALCLAFGCVLWIYEHYVRRALALLRRGAVAIGTVEPGKYITFRFTDAQGVARLGRSGFRRAPPAELVPGAEAIVLYDPAKPKRNALVASLLQLAAPRSIDAPVRSGTPSARAR